ncbi:hypothetical protein BJY24_003280 [Nocardia transvalensis]|uniref:Uncharacterized protein n=1 Tax=Nocardia transvalensis TaxID=37333 RepID=A0A7W9PEX0_9NOCA|nr:hypothetical protein [Nocardia transvalensis]MBB5914413.1 hypothetical protein [Nocardia transvalensis]
MRTILLSTALLTAGIAAALGGAGQAAAGVPVAQPDQGRIGVNLSHEETAALAAGPVPAMVTKVVPQSRMGAGLQADTDLYRDDRGSIHASLRQVIMEAAEHPDGSVAVFVNAPGTHGARVIDIYQRWN